MLDQRSSSLVPAVLAAIAFASTSFAQDEPVPTPEPAEVEAESPDGGLSVPFDLLGDEHVREEFGINEFTTPSIRKLFSDLDDLGRLPYDKLRRDFPDRLPSDRSLLALSMGVVIADGFLVVQAQAAEAIEPVGRAVLDHAKALGAQERVAEHAKSLLEQSLLGDWDDLRDELGATQADVEAEMILLRDVEMAHLISLGGWIRGLHIASTTAVSEKPFSPDKASALARRDLVAYYESTLAGLHPRVQTKEHVQRIAAGLSELTTILDIPPGRKFTVDEVIKMSEVANSLLLAISPPEKE